MKVCIAEKPSVAKDMAQVLGANIRKDGYFEGNNYQITWAFGHLFQLKSPEKYSEKWAGNWNFNNLPILIDEFETELSNDKGIKKQFKIIKSLVEKADVVINCGDAGQEGELIQRWILEKIQSNAIQKRLWISSLTQDAIKEGFNKLYDAVKFDHLFEAGKTRAYCDWLLGMNATRAYTLKYGCGDVFSVGRVQTPTLSMIVKRDEEIENFKPENFYQVKTNFKNKNIDFSYTKDSLSHKFKDKKEAEQLVDEIKNEVLTIQKIDIKESFIKHKQLFDLTSLQIFCSSEFKITGDQTLKSLQSLYEKKYTTYPRTDSRYLTNSLFKDCPRILKQLKSFDHFIQKLDLRNLPCNKMHFDDSKVTDHHAIIPTGIIPNSLNSDEEKIYNVIVLNFIHIFFSQAKQSNTTILATSKNHEFKCEGRQILEKGYLEVFDYFSKNDKILPTFSKNESSSHIPKIEEKTTTPPSQFTDGTLIKLMETAGKIIDDEELKENLKENGIGRPSTRASIIDLLLKRGFIERKKNKLNSTQKGKQLIHCISDETLKSPALTGKWEKKLRKIEKGNLTSKDLIQELNLYIKKLISDLSKVEQKPTQLKNSLGDCPICKKGKIIENKKAFNCNLWKNGCKFTIWKTISSKSISQKTVSEILKNGISTKVKGFTSKSGKKFDACLQLENGKIKFKFN